MNDVHASKPDERQQHSRMCFKAPLADCRDTLSVYVPAFFFFTPSDMFNDNITKHSIVVAVSTTPLTPRTHTEAQSVKGRNGRSAGGGGHVRK